MKTYDSKVRVDLDSGRSECSPDPRGMPCSSDLIPSLGMVSRCP